MSCSIHYHYIFSILSQRYGRWHWPYSWPWTGSCLAYQYLIAVALVIGSELGIWSNLGQGNPETKICIWLLEAFFSRLEWYEDTTFTAAVEGATRVKYVELENKINSEEDKAWEIETNWLIDKINKAAKFSLTWSQCSLSTVRGSLNLVFCYLQHKE